MLSFYLIIVIVLFLLAISDLVVGVSNDAVNFLNSAVGAKVASYRSILMVAALGIIVGCTFSSGMMEVARKGIFHPEYFYFSEIILLFLAVMVTDVILLDTFNTFGMPTSTTVSIVFELLGAAVAFSMFKIINDPNALGLGEYINSGKALAIISGILLSVVVAFSVGAIFQYLTRLLFSFEYEKKMKYFGSLWGGLAIAAITFFLLVKGSKGASFMNSDMKAAISENAFKIIAISFVIWTVILQIITMIFKKFDMMKLIVMIGTFALAMAFAGNDLVNFIGVPLAGYNSYELYSAAGGDADAFLMTGLAGKVKTPTLLLLIAGFIMTITLWTSKKAKSVIKTSLDLGRQYEGGERFSSYSVSRTIVRNFSKAAATVTSILPRRANNFITNQFDERPFISKQANLGKEAPVFDMVRAASTLVVASILISIGTSFKLPLSTTYVTFMVFMGTSLADGAWGRESAVYRVSGVLSVIGGWFFTAFSAFSAAFIIACIFYFGGNIAILVVLAFAGFLMYRTHKLHNKKKEEQLEYLKSLEEGPLTRGKVLKICTETLNKFLSSYSGLLTDTIDGLEKENLSKLSKTYKKFKKLHRRSSELRLMANNSLDQIEEDELDVAHLYILSVDYIHEMGNSMEHIIKPSLAHIDNNHKTFIDDQLADLRALHTRLESKIISAINIYRNDDLKNADEVLSNMETYVNLIRDTRKKQIKRIKNHKIGTRNSLLYLNHLAEFRNLGWYTSRLVKIYSDLILHNESPEEKTVEKPPQK